MKKLLKIPVALMLISACSQPEKVDKILTNATIYTVDDDFRIAEGMAIKDGKIVYVGNKDGLDKYTGEVVDLKGRTVIPGLHEGHAHIMGIGTGLLNVDLMNTKSYQEVINLVKARAATMPEGTWIVGRGWHQDKWDNQPEKIFRNFPTHDALSEAVPNHPVWLSHASGHMGLANARAMEIAGITPDTPSPNGGEVFKMLGKPTGIFNENAEELIARVLPPTSEADRKKALALAIEACLKNGITYFHQAGSGQKDIDLFKSFLDTDQFKIRMHTMLLGSDEKLLNKYFDSGPESGSYNNHLNIRAIKLYADGALGSRGAWLLEDYSDAPGVSGHMTTPVAELSKWSHAAHEAGFQVCIHAIGDRANREVLNIFEAINEPTARFRIEHAQHLHPDDIPRFAKLGVLAAMQAIHMSSDRPWAINRLGDRRIKEGAYMWQSLLESGAKIINGTDAPVEPINPMACFYSSVSRKTLEGFPENGFEPAQRMTRKQALKSFTIDAAYGAFSEHFCGSLEVGKVADLIVLDKNIMEIPEAEILGTSVVMTMIDGKVLYKQD